MKILLANILAQAIIGQDALYVVLLFVAFIGFIATVGINRISILRIRKRVAQAKEILKSDPNAPFKVIQGFIDEKNLVKSAAAQESLRGGRIVGSPQIKRSPEDECYERMCKILHRNL